jgi:hypothetical protein
MKSHPSKIPSQDNPSSMATDLPSMSKATTTPNQPELSGRDSVDKHGAWKERLERRRELNSFDDTIAQKIAGIKGQNPKPQPYEVVMFYLRERTKAEEQLRVFDQAEMQKMAGYELKDFPPISDSAMPKISLRMMISTTLAVYPQLIDQNRTLEEVSDIAARAAWNVINSSWKLLDSVEKHRQMLQMWTDQDRTRVAYFRQDRVVGWKAGVKEITAYNETDSPWRFKDFLDAYYGQVLFFEENTIFSPIQHFVAASDEECRAWVDAMDEFYRSKSFTKNELSYFQHTFQQYVRLGILRGKGTKDEKTTTRPVHRRSKRKPVTSTSSAKAKRK